MSFSQAISGLNAASSSLDVIGNNIANSQTAGFKSGSVAFADMYAGSVGLGVKVAGINQDFNNGAINSTNRALDLAISGSGFFRVQDSSGGIFYTRNGQFKMDSERNLITQQGMQVTGYPATGTPPTIAQGAQPGPLSIPEGGMGAQATTSGNMQVSLQSTHKLPTITPFDPTNPDSYNYVSTVTTYDSLGNEHNVNMYFVKTADNQWNVYSQDSSSPVITPGDPTATPPTADTNFQLVGELEFNTNGTLATNPAQFDIQMGALQGAPAQEFALNFTGSTQQNTGSDGVSKLTQNGYKPGDMTGYQINDDGTLVGLYSNGQKQLLGQIAMGSFSNPEGLQSMGDNVWSETAASGQPRLGTAGAGNFGKLVSGALESSNVDMGKQLVEMIVAQRNYQSNAQTIKTQDSLLQTLVSLR